MAWGASWEDRLYVIGGYAEQRVDQGYHHVYDPQADRWTDRAPLPRGANHVGVVADAGLIYCGSAWKKDPVVDCVPAGGRFQAAVLTVWRAC